MPVNARLATALCLLLAVSACSGNDAPGPTAPTPPNIPPASPTFTLSGVITERLSGRPVEGARVSVRPFSLAGFSRWPPQVLVNVTPSDASGRYSIAGLPATGPAWVNAWQGAGNAFTFSYVQQCVATATIDGDTTLDLQVTSTSDLTALNASTGPTPPHSRVVSGTVFEMTPGGRQPLGDAWVGWEATIDGAVMAHTRSDAAGRFRLCGLPLERIQLFAVPASRTAAYVAVDAATTSIDIEITR